jgi:protocatechuate 3,4-dioxygenase alpha subunit
MSDRSNVATPSQTVGPFFHVGMTRDEQLRVVTPPGPHEPIELVVRVTDGDGRPVPDGVVELWQAGRCAEDAYAFGRSGTSADGACRFETVRPSVAPGSNGAPHINACLFARGLLRQLHTRIYFPGDAGLEADPVLMLVDEARRRTLFANADCSQPGRWHFHVRLQGPDETVFFAA